MPLLDCSNTNTVGVWGRDRDGQHGISLTIHLIEHKPLPYHIS